MIAGRGFLLLPAAALAVHELRYRLAYGDEAGQVLAAEGHGYVNSVAPWLVLLLAVGLGAFLVRVARVAAGRRDSAPRRSFVGLWLLAATSLFAIYGVQELLEGMFATGHPSGLAGVVGSGGWWALGASLVLGAVVAALLRFASAVVAVAARLGVQPVRRSGRSLLARPVTVALASRGVLAGAAAGRAPPSL
jgi:hypothetical protein